MTATRPRVLIVCNQRVHDIYLDPADLSRLETFASWEWLPSEGGESFGPTEDPAARTRLLDQVGDATAVVVCHGAPLIDGEVFDRAPGLRVVGELEGDRFAKRIDVEAAWQRQVHTIDTTNGSSYPVAEWALGLILVSLRNAGEHFRHMIQPKEHRSRDLTRRTTHGLIRGDLFGKKVGLIGCGHIGRRLISFLKPFHCDIRVHDPYIPKELADALGFLLTSLDHVLSESDVVVCLVPLTPGTHKMLGARELALLKPDTVFVNVSRGAVVDSDALIERLRQGDIIAGLDVFDPEPIPADSPIKQLPNVFLTPHISTTYSTRQAFFRLMVDELDRFFHGHETLYDLTPRTLANRRGTPQNR